MKTPKTPTEQPDETVQSKGGYTRFGPTPWYGTMGRNGQVIDAGDGEEKRYISGYDELREQARKASSRDQRTD